MSVSLSNFQISLQLTATLLNSINSVAGAVQANQGFAWTKPTWATGTGASQADRIWHSKARALTSGTSEDLDLFDLAAFDIGGGAGKDALGQSWATVEVCGIIIENISSSAGNLMIGGKNATTAFNSLFHSNQVADDAAGIGPLFPGGCFMVIAPTNPAWAVADTTNHLLKIAATGGNVTYNIAVLARSA